MDNTRSAPAVCDLRIVWDNCGQVWHILAAERQQPTAKNRPEVRFCEFIELYFSHSTYFVVDDGWLIAGLYDGILPLSVSSRDS